MRPDRKQSWLPSVGALAQVSLLAVTAIWGLTFVMVQDAITRVPVLSFLAERFLLAAVLVAVLAARRLRELSAAGWRAGAAMGVFLTAGYVLQTYGLAHTSAAHSGFITGLFVVFTPLLAAAVARRRPPGMTVAGAALSLAGLALLTGRGGPSHPLGDALTLGCALAFSVHILFTDRHTRDHATSALLAVQLGVCGLACLAAGLVEGGIRAPNAGSVWLALLVTAILASALAFFVQTAAQRHAPPERAALIMAAEPVFAGLFAYLVKGQQLTAGGWAGAVCILGAILLVELAPRRRGARDPTPEGALAPPPAELPASGPG